MTLLLTIFLSGIHSKRKVRLSLTSMCSANYGAYSSIRAQR